MSINLIRTKFAFLLERKWFEEIYIVICLIISIIGWLTNAIVAITFQIVIASIMIALTEDLKYVIPNLIYSIFTLNEGFEADKIPISLIIVACILVIILVVYTIKNGINIAKMRSFIGLLGLGITTLIPILWFNNEDNKFVMLYFVYFCNLAYFIIYFFFSNGIKQKSSSLIIKTFAYLSLLLFTQILVAVSKYHFDLSEISNHAFYVGWGLCNEVGIMFCFSLPFIFILLNQENNNIKYCLYFIFTILSIIGVIFTSSRASYIFILAIFVILTIFTIINAKNKKMTIILYTLFLSLIIICCCIFYNKILILVNKIVNGIFSNGLSSPARIKLFQEAWDIYTNSIRNIFFGAGICTEIKYLITASGWKVGQVVFHSTFFETLVASGIIGLCFLLLHFFEKYRSIFSKSKLIKIPLLIGFIFVDIYGMADNTYHMFYYMIPLVIVLASFDSEYYFEKENFIKK